MNNVQHSSDTPRWGTHPKFIEIGRACLRALYVDPFSEDEFNEHVGAWNILDGEKGRNGFVDRWLVDCETSPRADHLLSGIWRPAAPPNFEVVVQVPIDECDSIADTITTVKPTAFVNAPGSDDGENIKNAYKILELYWRLGWLPGGAIWIGFSLNQLQTLQNASDEDGYQNPLSDRFVRCIPSTRYGYTAHSSTPATKVDKRGQVVERDDAPSHPSWFMLMPAYDPVIAAEQFRIFDSMASQIGVVF